MRVGLLGDTHGQVAWMLYAIDKFKREGIDTVIQLGDLGIWPGQAAALGWKRVNNALRAAGQFWYVVPGNHEDYNQINNIPIGKDGLQRFRSNIWLIPRGHRWEWDGSTFVGLGGAPSVDRAARQKYRWGWWPEEMITDEDVAEAARGGYADVMVAHDAPWGVAKIALSIAGNPHGFTKEDLEYANVGRDKITTAVAAVHPKFFFHGHYHTYVNEFIQLYDPGDPAANKDVIHVIGLTRDDADGFYNYAMGEYDTRTQRALVWDIKSDYHQNRWLSESEKAARDHAPPGWRAYLDGGDSGA